MPLPDKKHPERSESVFTGERFIPQQTDPILALEHYHRYCLASRFVSGKRVLDIACGEGYGSAFLSQKAGEVVGIDSDVDTVNRAREKYSSISNLIFAAGRCEDFGEGYGSFDTIVSFETLEHLDEKDQRRFIDSVRHSLNPDGLFIVSSPDRDEYAAVLKDGNQFHKHERTLQELKAFLQSYFKHVHICAQRVLSFSAIWQLRGWRQAQFLYCARKDLFEEIPPDQSFSPPLYLIALCSNTPLAEDLLGKSNSFYFEKSATNQTDEWLRWMNQLNARAQSDGELIKHLQRQLDERMVWIESLEDRIHKAARFIDGQKKELEERTQWIRSTEKELKECTQWALSLEKELEERTLWIHSVEKKFEERTKWALSLESEIAKERAYSKKLTEAITGSFLYRALAKIRVLPRIYEL